MLNSNPRISRFEGIKFSIISKWLNCTSAAWLAYFWRTNESNSMGDLFSVLYSYLGLEYGNCNIIVNVSLQHWRKTSNTKMAQNKMSWVNKDKCHSWCQIGICRRSLIVDPRNDFICERSNYKHSWGTRPEVMQASNIDIYNLLVTNEKNENKNNIWRALLRQGIIKKA